MVGALLADVVGAFNHAVGFVIDVGSADGVFFVFFVFVVDFLRGVAALVVAVVGPGLPTVVGLLGDLVEVVELVVDDDVVAVPFIGQVAQAVVLVVFSPIHLGE